MVETILFNLATKVVQKIGSLALREFGLAWGLEDELRALEDTLSTIKGVLLDAERLYINHRNHHSIEIDVWFQRLQSAFYEADNLLDEFHYEVLKRHVRLMRVKNHRRRRSIEGIQKLVRKFFSCSTHTLAFRFKFKMGCKIEKIRKKLDMIADDRIKFHPIITPEDRQTDGNGASTSLSSNANESDIVGRDDDRARILELLKTSGVDEKISVIPIVGIGGLGKTTLVKFLYNDETVVEHFGLRIWVKVAQDFNVKDVVRKIIQCITDSPRTDLNSNQLKKLLQEKLHGRTFLLVLDDLCDCDNRDWLKFCNFLRGAGAKGSKIIVTTRNKCVATTVGTVPIYNLGSLSDEDCHELLLKWAGCRENLGEEHGTVNLSEIAKEIVKKCHGCPLAAKTLGNNLFMETDESKWLHLKEKELWELMQKKHDILAVLRSSYNGLPIDLKRCFIYCSLFPKRYEIEIDKLIQLWMAQGFIQSSGLNREFEDTGIDYLNQLCSIFFLEKVEQRDNVSNTCRMHEIIHDLAVLMANEECLSIANYRSGSISGRVKHVSFRDSDCSGEGVTKWLFKLKNMRTVFFPFQGVGAGDKGFVDKCLSKFKYLCVLDLSNSCFSILSRSIGNLKHLRFLDLSGNENIKTLPNAICKLYNLQTLRIWCCVKIRELPKNIGNLISLRHLYLTTQQSCLSGKQIRCLTSLQSFRITGCGNLTSLPEEMQLLVALKTVTIFACPNLTSLPTTMKNLANFRNLEISNCPNLNLSEWEDFRGLRRLQ